MVLTKAVKVEDFVPNEEESQKMQKMTEAEEKQKNKANVMTEEEPLEQPTQEPEVQA